jgi:glutathione S-transferase
MRLYYHPVSANARRVTLAAQHMGAPLELTEVNLLDEADRRRLLAINLNNKVPVLQDGDFVLWESCAIMQYLADQTPGHTLYPRELRQRADIHRWMFWGGEHFAPALATFAFEHIWKGVTGQGGPDPAELERAGKLVARFAAVADAQLAGRQWLLGDSLTLADFVVATPLMYIEQAHLPVKDYANLMAWFGRVQQLEAWKRTEPVW